MKSILATNKFDNIECNFKIKTNGPKVTLESLAQKLDNVMNEIQDIKSEVKSINARIDNLVIKNNLKE